MSKKSTHNARNPTYRTPVDRARCPAYETGVMGRQKPIKNIIFDIFAGLFFMCFFGWSFFVGSEQKGHCHMLT